MKPSASHTNSDLTAIQWKAGLQAWLRLGKGGRRTPHRNPVLDRWVRFNTTHYGSLSAEQIRLLLDNGFSFGRMNGWFGHYVELEQFHRKHGHCLVTKNHFLGVWVKMQRARQKCRSTTRLTPQQVKLLNRMDFEWDGTNSRWHRQVHRLRGFIARHGHACIARETCTDALLLCWAAKHRMIRSALPPFKVRTLNELGFVWNLPAWRKGQRYRGYVAEFEKFRRTHGHLDLSPGSPAGLALRRAASYLRERRRAGAVDQDTIRALDRLGFDWEGVTRQHREKALKMLKELREFKRRHGHVDVPVRQPLLGKWVKSQISRMQRGRLPTPLKNSLLELGVSPNRREAQWMKRYERLRLLLRRHKTMIHAEILDDEPLCSWCRFQRLLRKRGRLPSHHIHLLEEIGFEWTPPRGRKRPSPDH